jgi:hypothetical protein
MGSVCRYQVPLAGLPLLSLPQSEKQAIGSKGNRYQGVLGKKQPKDALLLGHPVFKFPQFVSSNKETFICSLLSFLKIFVKKQKYVLLLLLVACYR